MFDLSITAGHLSCHWSRKIRFCFEYKYSYKHTNEHIYIQENKNIIKQCLMCSSHPQPARPSHQRHISCYWSDKNMHLLWIQIQMQTQKLTLAYSRIQNTRCVHHTHTSALFQASWCYRSEKILWADYKYKYIDTTENMYNYTLRNTEIQEWSDHGSRAAFQAKCHWATLRAVLPAIYTFLGKKIQTQM